MHETRQHRRYITGPQVQERYGGVSSMWLWRREHYDALWPKPVIIGGRKFYDLDDLDDYDDAARAANAAVTNAGVEGDDVIDA